MHSDAYRGKRVYNASELYYETALSVLALNQLHLRILKESTLPPCACRIWLEKDKPANIYHFNSRTQAVAIAPRSDAHGSKSRDALLSAYKALQAVNAAWDDKILISVVESPEFALLLHQNIPEEVQKRTLYITDHETFYGKGGLQLIKADTPQSFSLLEKNL